MSDTTTDLLQRLTAATGPDRELDVALEVALGGVKRGARWCVVGAAGERPAEHLTASFDLALAFARRLRPDLWVRLAIDGDTSCRVSADGRAVEGATPALALLAALARLNPANRP